MSATHGWKVKHSGPLWKALCPCNLDTIITMQFSRDSRVDSWIHVLKWIFFFLFLPRLYLWKLQTDHKLLCEHGWSVPVYFNRHTTFRHLLKMWVEYPPGLSALFGRIFSLMDVYFELGSLLPAQIWLMLFCQFPYSWQRLYLEKVSGGTCKSIIIFGPGKLNQNSFPLKNITAVIFQYDVKLVVVVVVVV